MSQNSFDFDTIIVGAGPAGLTAGMYAGRGMLKAIILESKVPGGELLNTEKIEDYPGFESILGGTSPRRWRPMR
jgi:thioredoxin reductase (NADPH)